MTFIDEQAERNVERRYAAGDVMAECWTCIQSEYVGGKTPLTLRTAVGIAKHRAAGHDVRERLEAQEGSDE